MLSRDDRNSLQRFLEKLRGAPTKVIITSRGEETWLGSQNCFKLPLGGLRHEEVWEYAAQILDDLGVRLNRRDAALADLLEWLGGHPLAMQAVLPQLEKHNVPELWSTLENNLGRFSGLDDEIQRRLYSCLDILRQSLPEDLRPLLVPLSLHEKYLDVDYLAQIAQEADQSFDRVRIDLFVSALTPAGLLTKRNSTAYEIHPLLATFLRGQVLSKAATDEVEEWTRAFVMFMALLAEDSGDKEPHEQQEVFAIHQANFHHALLQAGKLGMELQVVMLTQSLAVYAFNRRNFTRAEQLYAYLVNQPNKTICNIACSQLGNIAIERSDYYAAEQWFLRAIELARDVGNERRLFGAYYGLGIVAHKQGDRTAAKRWYRMALDIPEGFKNEREMAAIYNQLGMAAQDEGDYATARQLYLKALEIKKGLADDRGLSITHHQLGVLAQLQHDVSSAEESYLKSLAISEKLADEHGASQTYHQLGTIAEERHDLASAERWYLKSVAITERLKDERAAASTYHQLGRMARARQDYTAAKRWFLKSLEIKKKFRDAYGAAMTYGELGIIAALQERYTQAGQLLLKVFSEVGQDSEMAEIGRKTFILCLQLAPPNDQRELRSMWEAAGMPPLSLE